MKRTIKVYLGQTERPLGLIHFEARGARETAAFIYDQTWLDAEDHFTLDPELPLRAGPQYIARTPGRSIFPSAVADTEPDGWARKVILRDHGKRRKSARDAGDESPPAILTTLDFLLAVDDFSRIGALRFQDEDGIFQRPKERGRRTSPPLIELPHLLASTRAVELGKETEDDLRYLRGRGTSLGGMRPKCTVLDPGGRLSIGKFPSVQDTVAVTSGEVLALRVAALAGIKAAHADLVNSDGQKVALIRRFDRTADGGRIPYASAMTLLGPEAGGIEHTYASIAEIIREIGASAQEDIEELWRRIALSILITNTDDHLRNHGFLHASRGLWRLSPAFDINPTPGRVRELKTPLSEDAGAEATVEGLMSLIASFRIPLARARDMLAQIDSAVSRWRDEGQKIGMSGQDLEDFSEAFEHEERAALRRELGTSSRPGRRGVRT